MSGIWVLDKPIVVSHAHDAAVVHTNGFYLLPPMRTINNPGVLSLNNAHST